MKQLFTKYSLPQENSNVLNKAGFLMLWECLPLTEVR